MILNIYKEPGWTSFDVVAKMRSKLHTRKIGHAGTLDPLAEGVLIVLTEQDTKNQDVLMKHAKEYVADIVFGITSPTYDLEFTPDIASPVTLEDVQQKLPDALKQFLGPIKQQVPVYSAVKVNGSPLYKKARAGKADQVALPVKDVRIDELEIQDLAELPLETSSGQKTLPKLKLRIKCSSGTYIRSLAHDLGVSLGTDAVMTHLLRTRVGDFEVKDSKKISEL